MSVVIISCSTENSSHASAVTGTDVGSGVAVTLGSSVGLGVSADGCVVAFGSIIELCNGSLVSLVLATSTTFILHTALYFPIYAVIFDFPTLIALTVAFFALIFFFPNITATFLLPDFHFTFLLHLITPFSPTLIEIVLRFSLILLSLE